MFRVIAQITAIVLAIMTGSAIGDSTHSGVAGFVIGLIAWIFLAWLLGVIGSVLDAIPGAVYDGISGRDEPRPRTYYAGTQRTHSRPTRHGKQVRHHRHFQHCSQVLLPANPENKRRRSTGIESVALIGQNRATNHSPRTRDNFVTFKVSRLSRILI